MCIALTSAVKAAVAEVNSRAARHEHQTPPAVVVLDCPAYWRKGRDKGGE
jgi:hypothetical protein